MVLERTDSLVEGGGPLVAWIIVELLTLEARWHFPEAGWEHVGSCITRLLDLNIPAYVRMSLLRLQSLVQGLLPLSAEVALTHIEAFELVDAGDQAAWSIDCQSSHRKKARVCLACVTEGHFAVLERENHPPVFLFRAGQEFKIGRIDFNLSLIFQLHGQSQVWPLTVKPPYPSWVEIQEDDED